MGYFADGLFTGFLASVKETGRKFKNGAKELVEDFVSGFNGHGWKLWKRGDSWRLELDELMVRKSFQVFELIINQITAIKGSQAITQGHAKIKEVTVVESADVYREVAVDPNFYYNSRYWRNPYETASAKEVIATTDTISTARAVTSAQAWVVGKGTKIPAKTVQITVNSTLAKMRYTYSDDAGLNRIYEITESGTYDLPASTGKLADNGFFFDTGFDGEIKQTLLPIETSEEIVQEPCYRIQIDDELNSITEYDLVRCQKGNKFYYVQVGSVFQYYINIPVSEFDTNEEGVVMNPPQAGDELVQFGSASHQEKYANRHSAIYLHVDEDEPAIDLMTDIYTKDWSEGNILKTRLGGNLPGTDGERGFYCVNGKLLFVDENGDTISVINPDGSASFARGQISWTKDGNPYFRGYIIAGDAKGKRIEINPNEANIEIYNNSGVLVNVFDGNSYESIDELFGGNIPKFTQNKEFMQVQNATKSTSPVIKAKEFDCIVEKYIVVDSALVVKFGGYTWISSNYLGKNGKGYCKCTFKLISRQYDKVDGTVLGEKVIRQSYDDNPGSANNYETELNLNFTSPGIFRVLYYLETEAYSTGDDVTAEITFYPGTLGMEKIGYLSRFFSNGIGLGTRPSNSFVLLKKHSAFWGDYMEFKYETENTGIKNTTSKLMLKSNPSGNEHPMFLLASRYISMGSISLYPNATTKLYLYQHISFDNGTPTLSVDSKTSSYWIIRMTFPNSWNDIGIEFYTRMFLQVECETYYPNQAYLHMYKDNYALIIVTPTNGNFYDQTIHFQIVSM